MYSEVLFSVVYVREMLIIVSTDLLMMPSFIRSHNLSNMIKQYDFCHNFLMHKTHSDV